MAARHIAPNAPNGNPSAAPTSFDPRPARHAYASHDRRARPSPTSHLTHGQYTRLMAVIEDAGGIATLDRIARALPQVSQPVSAVFDLCDAGVLNADLAAAFDGDMLVWRERR